MKAKSRKRQFTVYNFKELHMLGRLEKLGVIEHLGREYRGLDKEEQYEFTVGGKPVTMKRLEEVYNVLKDYGTLEEYLVRKKVHRKIKPLSTTRRRIDLQHRESEKLVKYTAKTRTCLGEKPLETVKRLADRGKRFLRSKEERRMFVDYAKNLSDEEVIAAEMLADLSKTMAKLFTPKSRFKALVEEIRALEEDASKSIIKSEKMALKALIAEKREFLINNKTALIREKAYYA